MVHERFNQLLGQLQPRSEFTALHEAIVIDAWRRREASSRAGRQRLERERDRLQRQLDQLDEAFLYDRVIDRRTYERQRDRLRERLALAEIAAAEAVTEAIDIEGVLTFAKRALSEAARFWEQGNVAQRRTLQGALS